MGHHGRWLLLLLLSNVKACVQSKPMSTSAMDDQSPPSSPSRLPEKWARSKGFVLNSTVPKGGGAGCCSSCWQYSSHPSRSAVFRPRDRVMVILPKYGRTTS